MNSLTESILKRNEVFLLIKKKIACKIQQFLLKNYGSQVGLTSLLSRDVYFIPSMLRALGQT